VGLEHLVPLRYYGGWMPRRHLCVGDRRGFLQAAVTKADLWVFVFFVVLGEGGGGVGLGGGGGAGGGVGWAGDRARAARERGKKSRSRRTAATAPGRPVRSPRARPKKKGGTGERKWREKTPAAMGVALRVFDYTLEGDVSGAHVEFPLRFSRGNHEPLCEAAFGFRPRMAGAAAPAFAAGPH